MREMYIGIGDYALGGAVTLPFLSIDRAKRRRPLVFGEVRDDPVPEQMDGTVFRNHLGDLPAWASVWKDLGADGVCLKMAPGPEAAQTVKTVVERTRMPVMVCIGDDDVATLHEIADTVSGSMLILGCSSEGSYRRVADFAGSHVVTTVPGDPLVGDGCIHPDSAVLCRYDIRGGTEGLSEIKGLRSTGLSRGDEGLPVICDVTGAWEMYDGDDRRMAVLESNSALCAMLAGADAVVVRGSGAADMASNHGEELAL